MKVFLAFVGLALLSISLADEEDKVRQCNDAFPDVASIFLPLNGYRKVFQEHSFTDENKCYFKCILEALDLYKDGKVSIDEIQARTANVLGVGRSGDSLKDLNQVKGKNDCDTAFLVMKRLDEIAEHVL